MKVDLRARRLQGVRLPVANNQSATVCDRSVDANADGRHHPIRFCGAEV